MDVPAATDAMIPCLLAAAGAVQHRITSGLLDAFTEWWQMPAVVLAVAAVVAFVIWMIRRDAAELPPAIATLLAALRLGAVAALVAAYLDLERTTEHEIVSPSRVAVLIDSSASMTLAEPPRGDAAGGGEGQAAVPGSRAEQALAILTSGGLLDALSPRHEVSLWRFDADAERLRVKPVGDATTAAASAEEGGQDTVESSADADRDGEWRPQVAPRGFETRLGDALARVIDQEPTGVLAGVIVLSDGATNAGADTGVSAAACATAGVPVFPIGIGSDRLPANVRVADLVAPARVFPGDRFAVTGYLQAQGLAGQRVRVELAELSADEQADSRMTAARGRIIDTTEAVLGGDGELVATRFDIPGLAATGRRSLVMRVQPPATDRTTSDDAQLAEVEVVDRVTNVLLMAGGPSREYQFMRNVLDRDKSFAVDVILGTASRGVSQDARKILAAFPETAESLDAYDAIIACDYDWRLLDAAAQARLERWVGRESGGLVIVAGGIFTNAWLGDTQTATIRDLHPVELRRSLQIPLEEPAGRGEPMPLVFTRDGQDAEFLWLAASRVGSQAIWSEFPGVFSCFDATVAKAGATVYARAERRGSGAPDDVQPISMAGQFYGSGTVFYLGGGELWRLRTIDDAIYERLITQIVRHVSQGRLLRGSRRARLLVDRDRFPVGGSVAVRVVAPDGAAGPLAATCTVTGPDGRPLAVPLRADPDRPDSLRGGFIAAQEGSWLIDVDLDGGTERVSRRVQARLPDRELERPRLDRGALEQLAVLTGGTPRFLVDAAWTTEDSATLAGRIPDRSRRDYETGAPDASFKQRLNALLMGLGIGLLCLEWIVRRLVRLA